MNVTCRPKSLITSPFTGNYIGHIPSTLLLKNNLAEPDWLGLHRAAPELGNFCFILFKEFIWNFRNYFVCNDDFNFKLYIQYSRSCELFLTALFTVNLVTFHFLAIRVS